MNECDLISHHWSNIFIFIFGGEHQLAKLEEISERVFYLEGNACIVRSPNFNGVCGGSLTKVRDTVFSKNRLCSEAVLFNLT